MRPLFVMDFTFNNPSTADQICSILQLCENIDPASEDDIHIYDDVGNYKYTDKNNITICSLTFPVGMTPEYRESVFKLISELNVSSASYNVNSYARDAMLKILELEMTEDEKELIITKSPTAEYFMLCDEEELGFDKYGDPDGAYSIRKSAESWDLHIVIQNNWLVVDLVGYDGYVLVNGGVALVDMQSGKTFFISKYSSRNTPYSEFEQTSEMVAVDKSVRSAFPLVEYFI